MRVFKLLCVLWICLAGETGLFAAAPKIIKVLPQFLDAQGQHTLSPSLYERDAYQAKLRKNPQLRSAIRFVVQWKSGGLHSKKLQLRLELHTNKTGLLKSCQFEQEVTSRPRYNQWSTLTIKGQDYKNLGEVLAWRVTLWDGTQELAEQKSFLW
jgi:hypothetical protein